MILYVFLIGLSLMANNQADCAEVPVQKSKAAQEWWKHAVVYQIYPRSFKDSDGDGVGDLQGIISKLGHLKETGVDAAWLSPIYKSPQVDAGYDISDYRDIHEEYGTLDDFDEMIKEADKLGIKIVMDFVPNHSSNLHEWFTKSENREEGYEDYYVWADGVDGKPPNNWISVFKYSAWQYSDKRKQWYLHQFAIQQPDLNFQNRKVVQEMKDILKFWMDRGVYGFRIDAVPHIFETGLDDEPPSGDTEATDIDWNYLNHIYTKDQNETFDLIYEFRSFMDEYNKNHANEDDRIMMTEAYTDIITTMRYYKDGDKLGAHFTFNFEMIPITAANTAEDVVNTVKKWMDHLPDDCVPNWVIGNHDNNRVASRVGTENVDGYNMLIAMLPGVAVTYNGEEIGMENGEVTWEQGQDPNACNGDQSKFDEVSRDFERTPFHWDDSKNAGFSSNDSTWLPVSQKYTTNNLKLQKEQEGSHYKIYQSLMELRKDPVLESGKMTIEVVEDTVISLERYTDSSEIVLLFNLGNTRKNVNLKNVFKRMGDTWEVKVSSTNRKDILRTNNVVLQPHESLIAASV